MSKSTPTPYVSITMKQFVCEKLFKVRDMMKKKHGGKFTVSEVILELCNNWEGQQV